MLKRVVGGVAKFVFYVAGTFVIVFALVSGAGVGFAWHQGGIPPQYFSAETWAFIGVVGFVAGALAAAVAALRRVISATKGLVSKTVKVLFRRPKYPPHGGRRMVVFPLERHHSDDEWVG